VRVMSLASGSSGNAYLLEADGQAVIVDAGVSLRSLKTAAEQWQLPVESITCLLLTHEHSDHVASAGLFCRRLHTPVLATQGTLARLDLAAECRPLRAGQTVALGNLAVTAFSLPHDGAEPVGYLFEQGSARVVVATDLGHVPAAVVDFSRQADLVVLESNHDVTRLWHGPYPWPLKQRVASAVGHLSNDQTADCLVSLADGCAKTVWLAHLSATNNSPRLALHTASQRLLAEGIRHISVAVALRDRPSLVWDSETCARQQALF
jgi:phosphoribosyl 1,2-cyclic phosphodiesterase